MKYLNTNIKINISKNRFWSSENTKVERIVNNRMYSIHRNGNKFIIKRQLMDFFDTMGGETAKLFVLAKGKIENNDNEVQLNLEVKPNSFALYWVFTYLIILILIFSLIESSQKIISIFLAGLLPLLLFLAIIKIGIDNFSSDLESDVIKL